MERRAWNVMLAFAYDQPLESDNFIERLERPGRSNVYRLRAERLAPIKAQHRDPQPRTLERLDQGTPECQHQDRAEHPDQGNHPDHAETVDRGNQNTETGDTVPESSPNPTGSAPVGANDKERLVDLLTVRGVHLPEARRLTRRYDAKRIIFPIKHMAQLERSGASLAAGGTQASASVVGAGAYSTAYHRGDREQ